MPQHKSSNAAPEDLILATLEELGGGAAVVLDRELRVVSSTARAVALLGEIPRGTSAPKLLCGQAAKRPIAEALAAGRASRNLANLPPAQAPTIDAIGASGAVSPFKLDIAVLRNLGVERTNDVFGKRNAGAFATLTVEYERALEPSANSVPGK